MHSSQSTAATFVISISVIDTLAPRIFCADLLLSGGCFALSRFVFTTPPEERGKEGGSKGQSPTLDMAEGRPVCETTRLITKWYSAIILGRRRVSLLS